MVLGTTQGAGVSKDAVDAVAGSCVVVEAEDVFSV